MEGGALAGPQSQACQTFTTFQTFERLLAPMTISTHVWNVWNVWEYRRTQRGPGWPSIPIFSIIPKHSLPHWPFHQFFTMLRMFEKIKTSSGWGLAGPQTQSLQTFQTPRNLCDISNILSHWPFQQMFEMFVMVGMLEKIREWSGGACMILIPNLFKHSKYF